MWVLLFLWGAVGMVQAKSPYYIVNGVLGVSPDFVPEESEIARITFVEPEDAIYIYGEKASQGAVIIETYGHLHMKSPQERPSQQKQRTSHPQQKKNGNEEWYADFIVFAICAIPVVLVILILWLKERAKKAHLAPDYVPKWQDADGYYRKSVPKWLAWIISVLFIAVAIALLVFFPQLIYDDFKETLDIRLVVISSFMFLGMFASCILVIVIINKGRKHYLAIDDKGIRGIQPKSVSILDLIREPEAFDLTWEQIDKIKMTTVSSGQYSSDAFAVYFNKYAPEPDLVITSVNLKAIDAVRFFSARNNKPNIIEN